MCIHIYICIHIVCTDYMYIYIHVHMSYDIHIYMYIHKDVQTYRYGRSVGISLRQPASWSPWRAGSGSDGDPPGTWDSRRGRAGGDPDLEPSLHYGRYLKMWWDPNMLYAIVFNEGICLKSIMRSLIWFKVYSLFKGYWKVWGLVAALTMRVGSFQGAH